MVQRSLWLQSMELQKFGHNCRQLSNIAHSSSIRDRGLSYSTCPGRLGSSPPISNSIHLCVLSLYSLAMCGDIDLFFIFLAFSKFYELFMRTIQIKDYSYCITYLFHFLFLHLFVHFWYHFPFSFCPKTSLSVGSLLWI